MVIPDVSMSTDSDYFTEQCENTNCHYAGRCVIDGLCDCDEGRAGQYSTINYGTADYGP